MSDEEFNAAALDDASNVTHSRAFAALNTLVDEGQIIEERGDYLKQKFKDLHTRVLTIYRRDNILLKRARQLRTELDKERQQVEEQGEVARKDDEEIQRLKNGLLAAQKELNAAQERESVLQVEALEYDRRRQDLLLQREDALSAEEARLRPQIERLQTEVTETGKVIEDMLAAREELLRQKESLEKEEATIKESIADFATSLAQAKQQYLNIEREPDRVQKQLQLVQRSLTAAKRELGLAESKLGVQKELITKLELERANANNDAALERSKLQKLQSDVTNKQKTLGTLTDSLEAELETRQSYQARLTELDELLRASKQSKRQEDEELERLQREKEGHVRSYFTQVATRDSLVHEELALQAQCHLLQKEIENLKRSRESQEKKARESKAEAEKRRKVLMDEEAKGEDFIEKSQEIMGTIHELESAIQEKCKREEIHHRELLAITTRRQEMNLECVREGNRAILIKNELTMKEMQLKTVRRRHEELQKRLRTLTDLFQSARRQRSHKAAQIQAITQKMTEVAEKSKILENELEVLLRESALKEKELIKKKRQAHALNQTCTHLRFDRNKQRKALQKVMDSEVEVKAQVHRMNVDVAILEDALDGLHKSYESAVESRNQTGIQLIDRNDALSLLCEKVKAQQSALNEGTQMTSAREEEVKAMKVLLADLLRDIQVCQKCLPKVREMEEELIRLNDAIEDERWRVSVLENDLSDPSNPHRWRRIQSRMNGVPGDLKGVDAVAIASSAAGGEGEADADAPAAPSEEHSVELEKAEDPLRNGPSAEYVQLQARCQDLESRLHAMDEKLREKALILEEVTELSERIGAHAQSGKVYTLALAKQVNGQQSGIRRKTRQMMATISELSLFQASSIQLQQEVQRLESIVAEAEQRLQAGEAPFEEAKEEYERAKCSNRRYAAQLQRRREEQQRLTDTETTFTTAEPRPNAYIPDGGLGIPKPFGHFSPFRPTRPAASLAGPSSTGFRCPLKGSGPAPSAPHGAPVDVLPSAAPEPDARSAPPSTRQADRARSPFPETPWEQFRLSERNPIVGS